MTTTTVAPLPVTARADGVGTLLRQYGCGPIQFTGTQDALYDRHLLFDSVMKLTAAGPREPENPRDRLPHDAGIEMAVALPLLLGLMADHFIDHPLIHALAGQRRNEAMPQHVITAQHLPLRVGDRSPEMVVGLVLGDSRGPFPFRLASRYRLGLAEQEGAFRPHGKPFADHLAQFRRHRSGAVGPPALPQLAGSAHRRAWRSIRWLRRARLAPR
jgi:hypothetical protein